MIPQPIRRAIVVVALVMPAVASSLDYLVDTTSDDGAAAHQICDSDATNANCSLRGALTAANASTQGPHFIRFDVPTSDAGYVAATAHWRFSPATAYPALTRTITIDGYTAPGASENTIAADAGGLDAVLRIEIRGPGPASGVGAFAPGAFAATLRLRGLAINGFQDAVSLFGSSGPHQVEGCFIGTDVTGTVALPNRTGIAVDGATFVGGTSPAQRNLISGNQFYGISRIALNGTNLTVQGNLIGTDATGTAVLGAQQDGLSISSPGGTIRIGGAAPGARNLFAGNRLHAIYFTGDVSFPAAGERTRIQGNWFGVDVTGTVALPNGVNPQSPTQPLPTIDVFRGGRCGIAIGGDAPGEGNLIANGGASGVHIGTCVEAPILGNAFRGNRDVPIDLSATSNPDGATPDDPGDADGTNVNPAGNRLQNRPEILDVTIAPDGGSVTIGYRVDTQPANADYPLRIEFLAARSEAPLVAFDTYGAGDAGLVRTITIPLASAADLPVFVTATDVAGNTSEVATLGALFGDGFE